MSDRSSSFLRRGSAQFLICGILLFSLLFLAHLHVLAIASALLSVAVAGALRRVEEQVRTPSAHGAMQSSVVSPIATRQTLEARLDAEWKRERAAAEPNSLLLIGLDALAQLEEQGGSLSSEVAMLTTANALARMLPRGADLLARYDERTFAVLLRATDLSGSLRVAARLRWSIVRLGIANPHSQSGFLTACMGLAVQHGTAAGSTANLLQTAEASLSRARQRGHDRLEYTELGEERHHGHLLAQSPPTVGATLPTIRAWTPEPLPVLHSPQS